MYTFVQRREHCKWTTQALILMVLTAFWYRIEPKCSRITDCCHQPKPLIEHLTREFQHGSHRRRHGLGPVYTVTFMRGPVAEGHILLALSPKNGFNHLWMGFRNNTACFWNINGLCSNGPVLAQETQKSVEPVN